MYRYSKTFNYIINKATFTFHKVVRRHYSGDVGEFIIFLSEIFSEIIKIGSFSPSSIY